MLPGFLSSSLQTGNDEFSGRQQANSQRERFIFGKVQRFKGSRLGRGRQRFQLQSKRMSLTLNLCLNLPLLISLKTHTGLKV